MPSGCSNQIHLTTKEMNYDEFSFHAPLAIAGMNVSVMQIENWASFG